MINGTGGAGVYYERTPRLPSTCRHGLLYRLLVESVSSIEEEKVVVITRLAAAESRNFSKPENENRKAEHVKLLLRKVERASETIAPTLEGDVTISRCC